MSNDNSNSPYLPNSGKIGLQDMVNAYNFARTFINSTKCDSALLKQKLGYNDGDYKRKVNRASVDFQVPLTKFSDFLNDVSSWKLGNEEYSQDLNSTINNWKTQNLGWMDILGSECVVQTKEFCDNISTYPYNGCEFDKNKGKAPYLEWQNTAGRCEINQNCMENSECVNGKCTCQPGVVDCPGNSECIGGFCETSPEKPLEERPGRCVMGNMAFRNWCENPVCRCQKSDTDCQNDLKNLSPFHYEEGLGKCFISKPYCRNSDLNYLTGLPCNPKNPNDNASTYSKCVGDGIYKGGPLGLDGPGPETKQYCGWTSDKPLDWKGDSGGSCMHIPHEGPYNDHTCLESNVAGETQYVCVGPGSQCYVGLGQQVGEFLVGKFLFAFFDSAFRGEDLPACFQGGTFDPDSKENFEMPSVKPEFIEKVHSKMKQVPETQKVFVDPKYIKSKKLIMPNFVRDKKTQEGLNLYLIDWKRNPYTSEKEIGFDFYEIKRRIPRLIETINGEKFIVLNKNDKNKEVRKMASTYGLKNFITKTIGKRK